MPNEYPFEVRRRARRLWLSGKYTDEQIAAQRGLPRADTIRDWRNAEDWRPLAQDIAEVIRSETQAGIEKQKGEFRTKYDQIGKALESRAIRGLNNTNLSPRDLKALAGALATTQRIREKALGAEGGEQKSIAEQWAELWAAPSRRDKARSTSFDRCLTNGDEADADVPAAPSTAGADSSPAPGVSASGAPVSPPPA